MKGMSIPEVTVSQVADDAVVLDVREPDEWAAGHAPGAVLIPMGELPARLGEMPEDTDTLAIVCRSGNRSGRVVAWLAQQGYDVANLVGGMQAWHAAGKPLTAEGGQPYVK